MRVGTKALLVVALLALTALPGKAQDTDLSGLKGLKTIGEVEVRVEESPGGEITARSIESELKTLIELRFRTAGLRIGQASSGTFLVTVAPFSPVDGTVSATRSYTMRASLFQRVRLVRSGAALSAATWNITGGRVGCPPSTYRKYLQDDCTEVVDNFLNDYLKWNPKPQ